jgi:hypothetical protein
MTEFQKSIHNKSTFIEMLMNLNLKLQYEVNKSDYVLPAGTIIVFPANDIDKLEIIIPQQEEDELTLEKIDNNIQELFENAPILPPKRRRGRPRKNKDLVDKAIEIFDDHPVYNV